MKDFVDHGSQHLSQTDEQQAEATLPGDADVIIIDVVPLYPEPEPIELNEILAMEEDHLMARANGPVVQVAHRTLGSAVSDADVHRNVEVGGLCFGYVFRSRGNGRLLIRVEEMIRAEHALAGATYVTFTYEAWRELIDIHERHFPDMRLLGWYHSHPGFGAFLSPMDSFIHNHFFTASWHIAVVIDPVFKQVEIFARCAGDLLPLELLRPISMLDSSA